MESEILNEKNEKISVIPSLVVTLGFDIRAGKKEANAIDEHEENSSKIAIIGKELTYKTLHLKRERQWLLNKYVINHFNSLWLEKPTDELDRDWFHRNKIGNVALFQHPSSRVLLLDIDTHAVSEIDFDRSKKILRNIISKIYDFTGVYPLYSEFSKLNRGSHIFYHVNDQSNVPKLGVLLRKLLSQDDSNVTSIDIRDLEGRCIRLPLASDYSGYIFETDMATCDLDLISELVTEKAFRIEYIINYEELICSLIADESNLLPAEYRISNDYSSIWEREGVSGFKNSKFDDIRITNGNRVGGTGELWKLVFRCVRNGCDYEEFKERVFQSNVDSKDLTKLQYSSNYEKDKKLKPIFDWASKKYNKNPSNGNRILELDSEFVSNLQYLTDLDNDKIEEAIRNYDNTKRINMESLKMMTKEFVGKHNYECLNTRKVSQRARLKKETKELLTHGVQFPLLYVKKLKKFHEITGSVTTMRSVIYNDLKLFSLFRGYFINSNGASCKQFKLTYINDYNRDKPLMQPPISFNHEGGV
ncbi:hypothetical protein ACO2IY_19015 [Leptospira interrogans]|uniref:hypothetical protein n=1 Tax=Leptospira interrogans TaxID=173 RepID=UPI0039C9156B